MYTTLRLFIQAASIINRAVLAILVFVVLALIVNVFAVAALRYTIGYGEIWMQELYVMLYASVFMLGAGYTLSVGGHVRIDLFYRTASPRYKAAVDMLGGLFVGLPFIWLLTKTGYPFVERSWRLMEKSAEAGGLPGVYLFKSLILAFSFLFGVQVLASIANGVLAFSGKAAVIARDGEDHVDA